MKRWLLGCGIGALVIGLAVLFGDREAPDRDAPAEELPRPAAADAAAYTFELHDGGHVRTDPDPEADVTRASLTLVGRLLLQPVASDPSWSVLSVREVSEADWSMNGASMPQADERFRGGRVYLRHDEEGRVQRVEADADAPAPIARVLETLAFALGRERGEGPVEVPTSFGRTQAALSRVPGGFQVAHRGQDYVQLRQADRAEGSGTRTATIDDDGQLGRVDAEESLTLFEGEAERGQRTVRIVMVRTELPDSLPRASLQGTRRPVAELRGDAARNALEQRAGCMSVAQMLEDLRAVGPGSRLPDHDRWLWRVTGLLQLDPEAAAALADACLDGSLEGRARQIAIELLANVGDPPAEAALRRVLADARVMNADDYGRAVQRTLLLRDPEDATIAMLTHQAETLEGEARRASFVAAGGLVGHARGHDRSRGDDAVRRMRQALGASTDPADRRALVMALGNAAANEALDDLVAAARDESDPGLRLVAARALGHLESEESSGELTALVADGDPLVQRAAVDALSENHPDDAQLRLIATGAAGLPEPTRVALITLAERLVRQGDPPREGLLALLEALRPTSLPDDAAHRLMRLRATLLGVRGR